MESTTELIVSCRNLFDRYAQSSRHVDLAMSTVFEDLCKEVQERLFQLSAIHDQIIFGIENFRYAVILETKDENGNNVYTNPHVEADKHNLSVLRMFTECFYYIAFRIRQVLRNSYCKFSGLSSFECVGVRDVRNHLIEHPEKTSKVFNQGFAFSQAVGFQLKTVRKENEPDEFHDAGILPNANEFFANLRNSLLVATKDFC